MSTRIQMARRRAVSLGASTVQRTNVSSRGTLDQTILQISTRLPGGGVWVFQGNGSASGNVLQSGVISAAGMKGFYSVMRSVSGTYLQVWLGNRSYVYMAAQRDQKHPQGHPQRRMQGLPHGIPNALGAIGQTNPNFVAPSATDVANTPPGQALADAAVALLAHFSSNGVTSEHASDSTVSAFQAAWNADPLSQVNANGTLSVDGSYGPNTRDALASLSGGTAPAVNTAPASGGGGGTAPSTTTTTTTTTSTTNIFAGMPMWAKWVVGAAAVGGAYVVGKAAYKKHGGTVRGHAQRLHGRLRHHARRLTRRPA